MNEVVRLKRQRKPALEPPPEAPAQEEQNLGRRGGGRWLGFGALLALIVGLAYGGWRYETQRLETAVTAKQQADFVPSLRVATVKASDSTMLVTLPGTTSAFTQANIFARASGYIDKRNVDIGDHVKAGQLLAQITAPELDHQIAQAEATVGQTQATLRQNQANADLANVTWQRDKPLVDKGWVTRQQGDVDRLGLQAQQATVGVAQSNVAAQQAQLSVLRQQKDYQSVVAPFDGVITQRNIDVGSLVQADATSGTFMFTIMQSNVIRTQVYVPQDQAFGLASGVEADIRVPEIPGRTFPGKVTRLADALSPGTRTLLTEIDVPNPDEALSPGVYCTVELHIPRMVPSLIVPSEAIVFNSDGLRVAVIENGT
ncbi:MAG TPA: efflux RND transporter periplasmic adaptor subunit, partial [Xanthobacteraceae bacterium]|nr:efflux RND transporter periplasmic adaptor subunit [Xanthobacteraceae bacterium]